MIKITDKISAPKLRLFTIILFTIFLCIIILKIPPYMSGDGREYLLQTEALLNHYSMDLRDEDFETGYIHYSQYANELKFTKDNNYGLHISHNGKIYSAHYGGYAVFVLPIKLLLRIFNINEMWSFQLTNLVLFISSILVVNFKLKVNDKSKLIMILLLMFNPVLYYITWTHTEVFTFAMVVIGLVFFYNKEYRKSILFLSLGAMQNPGIIMFGAVVGIDYLVSIVKKELNKAKDDDIQFSMIKCIQYNILDVLLAGVCFIPAFLPIIQSLINFGTINIVASVAREPMYMLEKAVGYLFDLNLGIIAYVPIILIGYFIYIIIGLKKNLYYTILNIVGLIGIFYVICNQKQINSGMNGIMRYNVWIIPIMIFYIVYNIEFITNKKNIRNIIIYISPVITSIMIIWGGGLLAKNFSFMEFSPWAKVVMNNFPALYNPYHGIFITRTTYIEGYSTDVPIIYADDKGYARKILLSNNVDINMEEVLIIGNEDDQNYVRSLLENTTSKYDYYYINIPKNINVKVYSTRDDFNAAEENENIMNVTGFYGDEGEFSWTKPYASIAISDDYITEGIELTLVASSYLLIGNNDKQVTSDIFINNKLVQSIIFEHFDTDYTLKIQKDDLPESYGVGYLVEIKSNATFVPSELGMGADNRKLSMLVKYIGNINN